jgi:F0F1-type ATP synthase delta subunit
MPAEAKTLTGALEVVTAVPLTEAEQMKYTTALDAESVKFSVDPAILGGVIVRTDTGRQVDASYAKQLAQLRASLS